MSNPRKNTYGYTIRINAGIDLSEFTGAAGRDITLYCSASSNGGFSLNLSASTLFIGASTVYSSTEGLTFVSGQWVYGQNASAQSFATADKYTLWLAASATGKYFLSPTVVVSVDA